MWFIPSSVKKFNKDSLSFTNLQSLALEGLQLNLFDEKFLSQFFDHFSAISTPLTVSSGQIKIPQLPFLVSMFSKLVNLKLDDIRVTRDPVSCPSLTIHPTVRGKLTLVRFRSDFVTANSVQRCVIGGLDFGASPVAE